MILFQVNTLNLLKTLLQQDREFYLQFEDDEPELVTKEWILKMSLEEVIVLVNSGQLKYKTFQ